MSNERRYARCPRCGGSHLSLIEVHEEVGRTDYLRHEVYDDFVQPADDFHFSPGDPVRVEMECGDCGHYWRSRRRVA